jgi:myosin heavy subunit
MAASWRDLISIHGAARFELDVQPFSRFIPAYEALANETVQLRHQNEELERQLAAAREASSSSLTSVGVAAASAAQVTKMQSKILELQDAVTSHYKQQAEGVRERLVLSETNQRLREESRSAVAERDRAVSIARAASEELVHVKSALHQREAELHTLSEELLRTRASLEAKCHEADRLRAENDGFVERLMAERGRGVEEVNAMNALIEATRRCEPRRGLSSENRPCRCTSHLECYVCLLLLLPSTGGVFPAVLQGARCRQ